MGEKIAVLFLDRDGTINHDIGTYVRHRDEFRLIDRADDAVAMAVEAGFHVVIITNQAGLAKGLMDEAQLDGVHTYMNELFMKKGGRFDKAYYCPSHPDYPHPVYDRFRNCRKPGTGMVERAIEEYRAEGLEVDRQRSFFVGDKAVDIECATNSGLRPVLVRTGYGEEDACRRKKLVPEYVARDLYDAVQGYILKQ